MAASAVVRLQSLVARELAPAELGVVTVSRLRAGHAENIIPDTATITLNFRAYDPDMQRRLTDTNLSPRARRTLMHRGPFREALTWLEIHGERSDVVQHWRALQAAPSPGPQPGEPARDGASPFPSHRRRRRRRGRRSPRAAS